MEKLINKRNIIFGFISLLIISSITFYFFITSQNKNVSLDENFTFKDIAKIFFLNIDLKNYDQIFSENSELVENFFLKAVNRYSNEIN